jgi:hypothetical protein
VGDGPYAQWTSLLVRFYLQQPAASAAEQAARKKRLLDFAQACGSDFKGYVQVFKFGNWQEYLMDARDPSRQPDAATLVILREGLLAILSKIDDKTDLRELLSVAHHVDAVDMDRLLAVRYGSQSQLTRMIQQMTAMEKIGCACWKERRGYYELLAKSKSPAVVALAKRTLAEKCR